jgi:hypothetical protein
MKAVTASSPRSAASSRSVSRRRAPGMFATIVLDIVLVYLSSAIGAAPDRHG